VKLFVPFQPFPDHLESIGVLVKRDTTSWEMNISSSSTMIDSMSLARSLELFKWCSLLPTIGANMSARAREVLYQIEPVYSTMGRSGFPSLLIFGVQYILETFTAVGYNRS